MSLLSQNFCILSSICVLIVIMYVYIGSVTEGTGICRLISTTNADCWDGTSVQSDDIDQFDGITIKDQGDNPKS